MARNKTDRGSGRAEVLRGFELHGTLVKAGTYIPTEDLGELLPVLLRRGAIRIEGQPAAGELAPAVIDETVAEPVWSAPTSWSDELVTEKFNG